MFIGSVLGERMDMLGVSLETLADETMLEKQFIEDILNNRIEFENIDEFDIEVISNALYCDTNYFTDERSRLNDVVLCSKNRGNDTTKSNLAKAKLQSYMRDLIWIKEALC
ncbi:hypothetical protein SAMN02745823_03799 [Sporobacter termitidis DSM 10068]|uniref:XRE family transcriptional regulator n=1 Tax=Sporobacter termitidis DSM 10068 TaxID=1123282 RepID=A0A1M5ZJ00_9FIRM|nr:hypothetical protein [Sporobacter termitidis]SHI24099.1 hypothetical protein SAMN02745823_03799 [Sporobacter termitidis DSM 10068]